MKKLIIIIVVALVLVGGVITGMVIYNNNRTDAPVASESTDIAGSNVPVEFNDSTDGFCGEDDIIE